MAKVSWLPYIFYDENLLNTYLNDKFKSVLLTTELKELKRNVYMVKVKAGQHILEVGEIEKEINLVVHGQLRIYLPGEDCANMQVAVGGGAITNISSYLLNEPSRYATQSLTESIVIKIEKSCFDANIESVGIRKVYYKLLAQCMSQYEQLQEGRVKYIQLNERATDFAMQNPQIVQNCYHKHVAGLLGFKPETFSRKKKLLFSSMGK